MGLDLNRELNSVQAKSYDHETSAQMLPNHGASKLPSFYTGDLYVL